MAEKRPASAKATMLHGFVIGSSIENGKIAGYNFPEVDNSFLTIAARDIPGSNRVKIYDDAIPLLASSQVSYKGQPVLAFFGFDSESAQLKSREIDISYQLSSTTGTAGQEDERRASKTEPVTYGFGDLATVTATEGLQTFHRRYDFTDTENHGNTITRITAEKVGDLLQVHTPTQWPSHVRETVSAATAIPKKRIIIHRLPFYASHDEMLIKPSILAAIAAVAAIKADCPAEILDTIAASRPRTIIDRTSWYTPDGRIVAESIDVTVDQGAAMLFSDEMARQLIAGLVPIYPLEALNVSITFFADNKEPAHFAGDLGYCDAVASTESHYSALAVRMGFSPSAWRFKYASESSSSPQQAIKCEKYAKLRENINEVCAQSDFQRKHAAYLMQSHMKIRLSTFFNYSRGIGIACGAGISGFSSECSRLPQQPVQVQLNPNNQVECNTSFYSDGASSEIWKQIISEELGVNKDDISFVDDDHELLDSGPSVLSANSGRMPLQIQKACQQIKEKRFVQPLPICESVKTGKRAAMKGSLFASNSWIALVLEVAVDTVTLQPLVRNVWISVSTARIFNEQIMRNKIRHTIVTTLLEQGAKLASGRDFSITISLSGEGTQISSSVTSAVKGAVMAAYHSALEQAVGTSMEQLPSTGAEMLAAMRGQS